MLYTQSFETVGITDTFNVVFVAGGLRLACTFTWCTENQEQWDAFNRAMETFSKADPLQKEGEPFDFSYDYIDWYLQFDGLSTGNNYQEYRNLLDSLPSIPRSLYKNNSVNMIPDVLIPRVTTCKELDARRLVYKECGVWLCRMDYNGDIRVTRVVPGGWAYNQDDVFRFRFTSEKDEIGYDDLQNTSFEVYVK